MKIEPQISEKEMAAYRWTQLKLDYHKRTVDDYAAKNSVSLEWLPAHVSLPLLGIGLLIATIVFLSVKP